MAPYIFAWLSLLPLALYALILVAMNFSSISRKRICPPDLVEEFEKKLDEKQYQEAYDRARVDDSVLGQVLSQFLAKLSQGYEQAEESAEMVLEEQRGRLEFRVSRLAFVCLAAPTCALLISSYIMMSAFGNFSPFVENDVTAQIAGAAALSDSLSSAFYIMGAGLLICVPTLVTYFFLRGYVDRFLMEARIVATDLGSRFDTR